MVVLLKGSLKIVGLEGLLHNYAQLVSPLAWLDSARQGPLSGVMSEALRHTTFVLLPSNHSTTTGSSDLRCSLPGQVQRVAV